MLDMKSKSALYLILLNAFAWGAWADSQWVTGQGARAAIGQSSFTRQSPISAQDVLGGAGGIAVAGNRLFVTDGNRVGAFPVNNRVLIFENLSYKKDLHALAGGCRLRFAANCRHARTGAGHE